VVVTRPERQRRERFIVEQLSQLFPVFTLAKRATNNWGQLFYTDKPANCGQNIVHGVAGKGATICVSSSRARRCAAPSGLGIVS
jgi:hypothetical protein